MCARISHGGQCPPYPSVGASLLATGLKARSCVEAGREQARSYTRRVRSHRENLIFRASLRGPRGLAAEQAEDDQQHGADADARVGEVEGRIGPLAEEHQ